MKRRTIKLVSGPVDVFVLMAVNASGEVMLFTVISDEERAFRCYETAKRLYGDEHVSLTRRVLDEVPEEIDVGQVIDTTATVQ